MSDGDDLFTPDDWTEILRRTESILHSLAGVVPHDPLTAAAILCAAIAVNKAGFQVPKDAFVEAAEGYWDRIQASATPKASA